MAAENGPAPQHLSFLREAAQWARHYGLFPLLRRAEAHAPNLPRIGASRAPQQNIVDLTQTPVLQFPGPTLDSIEVKGGRATVSGYWLGLTGPMGPLPLHLTEFSAYERLYARKRPFGRFLDMLAGRMLQFFYRAWADSQPVASSDRPADDRFAHYVAMISGAEIGAREDAVFPAQARLHYAALFASRRSAAGIQDALSHLLRTPVRLEEYQPRWRPIEPDDRSRLGKGFVSLGADAVLGGSVRTVTDAYRVVVRVDSYRRYESFLPTGLGFKIAAEALDAFTPSHLEWDLQLEAPESQVRPSRLDGRSRLGWTSWMSPDASGDMVRADTRLGRSARRIAREERGRVTA
ncbi:MAG: type VI secretion system baseplate subunit TssG [Caulobacteraceae bacterium]|nr:type VI secretion system baseplate subunit TssG [Caulobacteraceae bacterium]